MSIRDQRRAIRHLLDDNDPADAMAAYFAFSHPDEKTVLRPFPPEATRAVGYVAISRTGIDLFRPLVTMRLPLPDMQLSAAVIHHALAPGAAAFLNVPAAYFPLIQALFDVSAEERLRLMVLDHQRFKPIVNVLVTRDIAPNHLPRFMVRTREGGRSEVAASASLNWQSARYAELAVTTRPEYRRRGWGRSVVAAMVSELLANGRSPLYVVSEQNPISIQLAERVGFVDSGTREVLAQAVLKPPP